MLSDSIRFSAALSLWISIAFVAANHRLGPGVCRPVRGSQSGIDKWLPYVGKCWFSTIFSTEDGLSWHYNVVNKWTIMQPSGGKTPVALPLYTPLIWNDTLIIIHDNGWDSAILTVCLYVCMYLQDNIKSCRPVWMRFSSGLGQTG